MGTATIQVPDSSSGHVVLSENKRIETGQRASNNTQEVLSATVKETSRNVFGWACRRFFSS